MVPNPQFAYLYKGERKPELEMVIKENFSFICSSLFFKEEGISMYLL